MNIEHAIRCKSVVTSGLSPYCSFQSSPTEFCALQMQSLMNSLTRNICTFFDSAKQTMHAVSQNMCHVFYALRIPPIGDAVSTPSCVETIQRNLLEVSLYFISRRGRAGGTQARPSTAAGRTRFPWNSIRLGGHATAQHRVHAASAG